MLRFSGEMEHGNVRDGNEMRSAIVPIRVDERKGGRPQKERKKTKREATGEERKCGRRRTKTREGTKQKIPAPGGSGDGK